MHASGSHIKWMLEEIQANFQEELGQGKWTLAYVFDHYILPAANEVLSMVNLDRDDPILIRTPISIVSGTKHYVLPPSVQEIWRIVEFDNNDNVVCDVVPRNEYHPYGPGWQIEHNTLTFRPTPSENIDLHILHVPSYDVNFHYGTVGATASASETSVQLAAAPTLGRLDWRENAYVGSVLRIIPTSGAGVADGRIHEYLISGHAAASPQTVTLRTPLLYDVAADDRYEIVPPIFLNGLKMITASASMELGVARNLSDKRMRHLAISYESAKKAVNTRLTNLQMRTIGGTSRKSVDSLETLFVRWGWPSA